MVKMRARFRVDVPHYPHLNASDEDSPGHTIGAPLAKDITQETRQKPGSRLGQRTPTSARSTAGERNSSVILY